MPRKREEIIQEGLLRRVPLLPMKAFRENVERENTNFTSRESGVACKSRNVHGDVTCSIRPETLPPRHLENLRIKRFVRRERAEGRSFDYSQPLRGPLLALSSLAASASRGWNIPCSFFPNFRHEFYISCSGRRVKRHRKKGKTRSRAKREKKEVSRERDKEKEREGGEGRR